MNIVATTLTASNADVIADALASVIAQVDLCLVIDTGARDDTLEVARRVAGDKLLVRQFPWKNDFAAARNFALQAATEAGGQWALTVDTDERLLFDEGYELHRALNESPASVLRVAEEGGTYGKERIVRLPTRLRWNGPTHEALEGQQAGDAADLPGVRFRELPKDAAALRRKTERDIAILKRHTKQHGKQPRWFYYLGAAHQDIGEYAAAIDAYAACASLGGWAEEGAWACYRAAECCIKLQRWAEAIHYCVNGLAIRPATAELAWLAGWTMQKVGRHEEAVAWSRMAVAMGLHAGEGARFPRISFRYPRALYEGPYEVLQHAYKALGDAQAAAQAERDARAARLARDQAGGG
jgi:glycosyltransferase involved in cell wall biosynthesis